MNPEELKCPKCAYPVGKPIAASKLGAVQFEVKEKPVMCICIRCLTFVWLHPDKEPSVVSNKEVFTICTMRPQEMVSNMAFALRFHANLPLIDAEKN